LKEEKGGGGGTCPFVVCFFVVEGGEGWGEGFPSSRGRGAVFLSGPGAKTKKKREKKNLFLLSLLSLPNQRSHLRKDPGRKKKGGGKRKKRRLQAQNCVQTF